MNKDLNYIFYKLWLLFGFFCISSLTYAELAKEETDRLNEIKEMSLIQIEPPKGFILDYHSQTTPSEEQHLAMAQPFGFTDVYASSNKYFNREYVFSSILTISYRKPFSEEELKEFIIKNRADWKTKGITVEEPQIKKFGSKGLMVKVIDQGLRQAFYKWFAFMGNAKQTSLVVAIVPEAQQESVLWRLMHQSAERATLTPPPKEPKK